MAREFAIVTINEEYTIIMRDTDCQNLWLGRLYPDLRQALASASTPLDNWKLDYYVYSTFDSWETHSKHAIVFKVSSKSELDNITSSTHPELFL